MWHDIFPSHQRQSPYFTLILLLHHKATLPRNFALRQYVLRALSLALWGLAVRLYCHLTRMRPDSPLSAWFSFAVSDSATTCTCFDSSGFSTFCPFLGFLVFLPYLFNSFSNGCCGFWVGFYSFLYELFFLSYPFPCRFVLARSVNVVLIVWTKILWIGKVFNLKIPSTKTLDYCSVTKSGFDL